MRKTAMIVFCVSLVYLATVPAPASAIDWMQCKGTEIRFLMNKHPFTTFIEPKVAEFEKMTGIRNRYPGIQSPPTQATSATMTPI